MTATDTRTHTHTVPGPQDRRDRHDRPQAQACPGAPRPALVLQRRLVSRLVG
jgi:hypothetical protein